MSLTRAKRKARTVRLRHQRKGKAWVVYAEWEMDTINMLTGQETTRKERRWLTVTQRPRRTRARFSSEPLTPPDVNGGLGRGLSAYWSQNQQSAYEFSNVEDAVAISLSVHEDPHVSYHVLRIR